MAKWGKRLWNDEDGATMVEYALMVVLICAISVAIVQVMGVNVQGMFTTTSAVLPAA